MVTVSACLITHYGEKPHLVNCLRSLSELRPEEVCIVDTSLIDPHEQQEFWAWIRRLAANLGLNVKIGYRRWNFDYRSSKNAALDMATSDWCLLIDSDEMITREIAKDLRGYLGGLPSYVLAVRIHRLNMIADRVCLKGDLWQKGERHGLGHHPRIVRTGTGRYQGPKFHEVYIYPNRTKIPLNSPQHPKVDWHSYYYLHLWLYKDNIMRRRWGGALPLAEIPSDLHAASLNEQWIFCQDMWLRNKGRMVRVLPKGTATWVPIEWTVDPSEWCIVWNGSRFVYQAKYKGQGQR